MDPQELLSKLAAIERGALTDPAEIKTVLAEAARLEDLWYKVSNALDYAVYALAGIPKHKLHSEEEEVTEAAA